VQLGLAPTWCVLLIIAREFMVTSLRLVAVDNGKVLAANNWGKTKTVSQIIATVFILLFQYIQELIGMGAFAAFQIGGADSAFIFQFLGTVLILIATFFTVLSGVIYIMQNINVINTLK
jgi:CDP-diacylglycerol--glycerol-3-phosphate 3-phosphatidyltransferase